MTWPILGPLFIKFDVDRSGYKHSWYVKNRARILKKRRAYSRSNRAKISAYNKKYFEQVVKQNLPKHHDYSRGSRQKLKKQVIEKLGGVCACCSENELEFLTVDHVNEDGGNHRKKLRASGKNSRAVYRFVRDSSDVSGFQVLCWNCNMSKHYGRGVCFHKRK